MHPISRAGILTTVPRVALAIGLTVGGAGRATAQDSGFNLAIHATSHITAADIGLPAYPGATPYRTGKNDAALDIGFAIGRAQLRIMGSRYASGDAPREIVAFYRKALSRYGQVLECDHGKPAGDPLITRSGLTCSDEQDHVRVDGTEGESTDHELRAGSPGEFRIVAIENADAGSTRFILFYVRTPKRGDRGGDSP